MRTIVRRIAGLVAAACVLATPAWAVETVVVTAAPLPGTGIDADKIAGDIETVSLPDITRDRIDDILANTIATQLPDVALNDEQGSPFQPDLVYRGFEASPISGVAEGIAVYQDGVRLNESFGDGVNWDLIPAFAVRRFTLQSGNPVFGLNALGGAATLEMKSGLDTDGMEAKLSGGSYGDIDGDAQYGARFGNFGVYLAAGGTQDDGFRDRSPTTLRQAYGDLAYEDGGLTLHLSLAGADNDIAAVGPTPVELLARDRRAVFTSPQAMHNEAGLVQLRGLWQASDALAVSFSTYYRRFTQNLIDGNTTDVAYCGNDPAALCLEGNGDYPDDALYDASGNPVPASALPAGATPGETDFTQTTTDTIGAAAQLSWTAPIASHGNSLTFGASVDRGLTHYTAYGELGALLDSLVVVPAGVVIDQTLSPTASPPIEAPVNIAARNTYTGVYALDVFDITPVLALNVSARWNGATIGLQDRLGGALTGRHGFSRVNPAAGLTYKITGAVTVYADYSESSRAPTTGELSCADPASPCLLDAFLVSDPPLKQVVARTIEAGLRGGFDMAGLPGAFQWKANIYRVDVSDDILLLATDINGFGFFQNAGGTRRQGLDAHLAYSDPRWTVSLGYAYLDATFRDALVLSSNSPAADADGLIHVLPGDRLPLNPASRFTLSADFALTPDWCAGGDLRWQSGQYYAGDQSNQEPKLPGYTTVDIHTSYRLMPRLSIFGEIRNLLDARYATYAAFTQLDGLPPSVALSDPRTVSPSPGRLMFAGLRAAFW